MEVDRINLSGSHNFLLDTIGRWHALDFLGIRTAWMVDLDVERINCLPEQNAAYWQILAALVDPYCSESHVLNVLHGQCCGTGDPNVGCPIANEGAI